MTLSEQSNGDLVRLMDERSAAQENAARQLGHLCRDVSYGYPPAALRPARRMTNGAITDYFKACEAVDREARRLRSRRS